MSDAQRIGSVTGTAGAPSPFTAGPTGASRNQDAHGRFSEAVLAGRVYYMSIAAAAGTAYVGAAAGTPLLAIHNPITSGKILQVLGVGFSGRAAATAAGQTGLNLWAGVSVQPTGTATVPRSALTQSLAGSSALGFSNTALTASTALNLAMPLFTYYWATAAGAIMSPAWFDIGALVSAAPGNQIALGLTVIPTSVTADVSLFWEEVPYLGYA